MMPIRRRVFGASARAWAAGEVRSWPVTDAT
jgi:hypothetical protein